MEEILAMRRKNSPNSPTKIRELINEISKSHFLQSDKMTLKLEENESRTDELSKEVHCLKEEFEAEKVKLERKQLELEEHKGLLKDLKEEKENLVGSLKETEKEHKTLKKAKPSSHDEQLLESGKRKHKLYKEFTGIRWDYSAPESAIEGYITNKKDYLHKISYKSDTDHKTVKNLLWDDIYRSTKDSTEEDHKKNQQNNN